MQTNQASKLNDVAHDSAEKESSRKLLMEYILMLSPDGVPDYMDYTGLLIEVACLLTNPDISAKLDEDYFRNSAGTILKRLISFFQAMENADHIKKYLEWYELATYGKN